ncbi:MAG TPA: hypothetical protein DCG06_14520 [Deltaproteobacteria bacterium]|nr:hypothetical protein [Deltaproteobacteria bacterium]
MVMFTRDLPWWLEAELKTGVGSSFEGADGDGENAALMGGSYGAIPKPIISGGSGLLFQLVCQTTNDAD